MLSCAIVDDEPLSVEILEGLLKRIPTIEVVATFNDALSVLDKLSELDVDFLFLDIEMPNLSGIDLLKSLPHPPLTIITSANKNYAIDGFELNVVDYLLKPLTFERVLKAINKVIELKSTKSHHSISIDPDNYIYLKENKKMVRVRISDIKYLESIKDYVKVVTQGKIVITKQNLSHFEKSLDSENFIRIHRSFIVGVKHIDAYSCSSVEIGTLEIPIGRLYKDQTLKRIGDIIDNE
jgi:DNA-binding LytR/AlgR family response regulator